MALAKKKIVVVGGGTGTHMVLRGLRAYVDEFEIAAIVTMADSGGSTGRLRDEFGQLPVGDVRMALAALAPDTDRHAELLRQLFLYRFDKGEGLAGHTFGNLLLTALTAITGSEREAIAAAAQLLNVQGEVIPVTTDNVHLQATYSNGVTVVGEHLIDTPDRSFWYERITALTVVPEAMITPRAAVVLTEADVIVFGPGDLYTSVLANCVVGGFRKAVVDSNAELIYVSNLMSRPGQTNGMHAAEHVAELTAYIGRRPDCVIVNNAPLPESMVARYREEGTHPIENNLPADTGSVYAANLLSGEIIETKRGDVLARSLIRHDSAAVTAAIRAITQR